MHSSRMPTARSSSCSGWVSASVHAGIPPGCGPGDPPSCEPGDPPGQTPQLPPWVWAWRPARHAGILPPWRPAQGIPPAMYAGIPHPLPPSKQNHRQV